MIGIPKNATTPQVREKIEDPVDFSGTVESTSIRTVPHPVSHDGPESSECEPPVNTFPLELADVGPARCDPAPPPDYHLVLRIGEVRYRFVEKVHRSKMSHIWRAVELRSGSSVAVKIVARTSAATTDRAALSALVECSKSPRLVKCIRHCIKGNYWYQLLEWLDGETLAARLRRADRQEPLFALQHWLRQVAQGLSTLHDAGIVHGDVKPDNVFIVAEQARLIDLSGQRRGTTARYKLALTPGFACRDALYGAPVDPSDDVYSYAVTALCVLMNRTEPPGVGFKPDRSPPSVMTATQWKAMRIALEPERANRKVSIEELAAAILAPSRLVVPIPTKSPREPRAVPAVAPLPARRDRRPLRQFSRCVRKHRSTHRLAVVASISIALIAFGAGMRPPGADGGVERQGLPNAEVSVVGAEQPTSLVASRSVLEAATVKIEPAVEEKVRRLLPFDALIAFAGVTTASAQTGVEEPLADIVSEMQAVAVSERVAAPGQGTETGSARANTSDAPAVIEVGETGMERRTEPGNGTDLESVEFAAREAGRVPDLERELPAINTVDIAMSLPTVMPSPGDVTSPPEVLVIIDVPTIPAVPTIADVPAMLDVPNLPNLPNLPTRPDVTGRPDVPVGRPDVPAGRPDVPTGRPDVLPGRPDIPRGRPDIPRGRPGIG